jgi:hypothetical protein
MSKEMAGTPKYANLPRRRERKQKRQLRKLKAQQMIIRKVIRCAKLCRDEEVLEEVIGGHTSQKDERKTDGLR